MLVDKLSRRVDRENRKHPGSQWTKWTRVFQTKLSARKLNQSNPEQALGDLVSLWTVSREGLSPEGHRSSGVTNEKELDVQRAQGNL